MRSGLSLLEVALAALVLSVSGTVVIGLIHSSTVNVEITQVEALSRGLAADILDRYTGELSSRLTGTDESTKGMLGLMVKWDLLLKRDPWMQEDFPFKEVAPLLDQSDVKVLLNIDQKFSHRTLTEVPGMALVTVTVSWKDQGEHRREVTLAKLVDRK